MFHCTYIYLVIYTCTYIYNNTFCYNFVLFPLPQQTWNMYIYTREIDRGSACCETENEKDGACRGIQNKNKILQQKHCVLSKTARSNCFVLLEGSLNYIHMRDSFG